MSSLPDILFYVFAALALLCGVLMLVSRNPVNSAMFLVRDDGGACGAVCLLHAFFLAAIQILVYAGAVMVLFLFVIMLLDLKAEERRKVKVFGVVGRCISVGSIVAIFFRSLASSITRCRFPRRTSKRDRSNSAICCLRNICCRLKSFRCCCWSRWSAWCC